MIATVVHFPNTLPFRILHWNNLIDGLEQTLQLLLAEFTPPLPFWHDDKGGSAGGVLWKRLGFNFRDRFTLISESWSSMPRGS